MMTLTAATGLVLLELYHVLCMLLSDAAKMQPVDGLNAVQAEPPTV